MVSEGAHATVRLPPGAPRVVHPGDLLGRLPSCAVWIADPRVSEVRALVQLRHGGLWLVGLGGRLEVDGGARSRVRLEPGLRVGLAPQVALEVAAVVLPRTVAALRVEGGGPVPLMGSVASLVSGPWRVVDGFRADAAGWVWSAGGAWHLQAAGGPAQSLVADVPIRWVGGPAVTLTDAPLPEGLPSTEGVRPWLEVGPTEVAIATPSDRWVLRGRPAQILRHLADADGDGHWQDVAEAVWRADAQSLGSLERLRGSWDVTLARLRRRLREAGLDHPVVHLDGGGRVTLGLPLGDPAGNRRKP